VYDRYLSVTPATVTSGIVCAHSVECPANSIFGITEVNKRALALNVGTRDLAALGTRGRTFGVGTTFDITAGPAGGQGAVLFERTSNMYLDGSTHTFNVVSNGARQWV